MSSFWKSSSTLAKVLMIVLAVILVIFVLCGCGFLVQSFLGGPSAPPPTPTTIPVTFATQTSTPETAATAEPTTEATGEPAPPVEPTAIPTPVSFEGWQGEYFDNPNLRGEPVLVRDDPEINFNWGMGSPAPGVPEDDFSVRWTNTKEIPAGTYRFTVDFTGGVRLWIDDVLIVDKWRDGPFRSAAADVNLVKGAHHVRLEYTHGTGVASVQMNVEFLENYPDWRAEYFDNPGLGGLPVVVRNELEINHDWGDQSPIPGVVPQDNFSVRWTRAENISQGDYFISVEVEGGFRLWLDERMVIDSWNRESMRTLEASVELSEGKHAFRVEYFKTTGNGQVHVAWAKQEAPNEPPVAVISGPSWAREGQTVAFTARNSRVAEGSHLVGFDWDFDDGSTARGADVLHVYNEPGDYEVTLTVIDDKGLSDTSIHQIEIETVPVTPDPGEPPVAVINAPSQARVGDLVPFDASASQSASPIISYKWDLGDGTTANAVKIQHAYVKPGIYNITLNVTNAEGLEDTTNTLVEIRQVKPTPTPGPENTPTPTPEPEPSEPPTAVINGPREAEVGETVVFDGQTSEPGDGGPIVDYEWRFGDGTSGSGPVVQHTYNNAGGYEVVLIVTDASGQSSNELQGILVTAPEPPTPEPEPSQPPTAVIDAPTKAEVGEAVLFDGRGSKPGDGGPIVNYEWQFGDGTSDSGPVVGHTYNSPGGYQVVLIVTDASGQSNNEVWGILVEETEPIPTPEPTDEPDPGGLEGKIWALNNSLMLPGSQITIIFDSGQVSGQSGCNSYFGSYQTNGSNMSIAINGTSQQLCDDSLMNQENAYLSALETVTSYQVQPFQLELLGDHELDYTPLQR